MTFDEVLTRFDAKPNGDGYKAHCPGHTDDKESLSINLKDGKILLHCFAGCDTHAILDAVGLTMKDLHESDTRSPIVATYLYRDLQGEVRYRKTRTATKQFFFAKPDGHGGWITSAKQNGSKPVMDGVERLLYRVNELAGHTQVFIVEGEKDADRLWALGVPATTNDTGASDDLHKPKWTEGLTQQLRAIGATTVVCLPDNDSPGRAHMQAVAQRCMAAGIEARIVTLPGLPVKGDVSDYLNAGHTVADLMALVDESPPASIAGQRPQLIIHKASDVPDERLEKLFGGRLVRGSFALVAGPGEGGKGMFMVDTAARFTTGEPFPGEKRRNPAVVLLCVTEDSQGRVKSRLRAAGANLDLAFFVEGPEVTRGGLTMASPMMLDDDAGKLVSYARQIKAQACLIETMVEHFGDREGKASRRSTNNEADVRSALSPFRAICAAAGLYGEASIHPRKTMEGSIDDSISGSAAFRNVTRVAHHIYRDPEDEEDNPVRLLFTSKSNYLSRRPPTLRFRIRSWDEERGLPCLCPPDECPHEGRIVWEDDLVDKRLAEEIWQQISERNKPRRDVNVQEAEAFLTGLMKDGSIALSPVEIFKLAGAEGITKASVKRAKENLQLVSKKDGFPAVVVGWQKGVVEL